MKILLIHKSSKIKGDSMGEFRIEKIEEGTVIDHITAGNAPKVIETLKLAETGDVVSAVINVTSTKLGRKDLVKIEGRHLDPEDVKAKISSFAPNATVNWIKDSEVVKKVRIAEL